MRFFKYNYNTGYEFHFVECASNHTWKIVYSYNSHDTKTPTTSCLAGWYYRSPNSQLIKTFDISYLPEACTQLLALWKISVERKDGSLAKSNCYSGRGSKFGSQYIHRKFKNTYSLSSMESVTFPCSGCMSVHTHTHIHTHTHLKIIWKQNALWEESLSSIST